MKQTNKLSLSGKYLALLLDVSFFVGVYRAPFVDKVTKGLDYFQLLRLAIPTLLFLLVQLVLLLLLKTTIGGVIVRKFFKNKKLSWLLLIVGSFSILSLFSFSATVLYRFITIEVVYIGESIVSLFTWQN